VRHVRGKFMHAHSRRYQSIDAAYVRTVLTFGIRRGSKADRIPIATQYFSDRPLNLAGAIWFGSQGRPERSAHLDCTLHDGERKRRQKGARRRPGFGAKLTMSAREPAFAACIPVAATARLFAATVDKKRASEARRGKRVRWRSPSARANAVSEATRTSRTREAMARESV
jgi:hypothetical protein